MTIGLMRVTKMGGKIKQLQDAAPTANTIVPRPETRGTAIVTD